MVLSIVYIEEVEIQLMSIFHNNFWQLPAADI